MFNNINIFVENYLSLIYIFYTESQGKQAGSRYLFQAWHLPSAPETGGKTARFFCGERVVLLMSVYLKDRKILKKINRIHMVGIGGSGMCALAEILHGRGYRLTGSDVNETDTLKRIKLLGIPVAMRHAAENVGDAELLVNTAAVHEDNPEIIEAKKRGIPVIERAELLGLIADEFENTIAISGTHGKTTTTSMITQILLGAKLDPTAIIGGKLPLIGGSSRAGKSQTMVCEACEFVDSFLHIHPAAAVVLNIDNDHLEYFKTVENTIEHFKTFLSQTSRAVIYNGDDANTCKALDGCELEKLSFGFGAKNLYHAADIRQNGGPVSFSIIRGDEKIAHITLKIPGRHNIYNALAACAASLWAGASEKDVEDGLNAFAGAGRRFEILGTVNGVTIADDYAHHPAELKATLEAAKQMGYRKVWAVFQPFTYSRTAMLMDDFAKVLPIADQVVLAEIMGSREKNTYNIYSKDLAAKIPGSVWFPTFDEIAAYVLANAEAGDFVITLGCGDIYKAAKMMLKRAG